MQKTKTKNTQDSKLPVIVIPKIPGKIISESSQRNDMSMAGGLKSYEQKAAGPMSWHQICVLPQSSAEAPCRVPQFQLASYTTESILPSSRLASRTPQISTRGPQWKQHSTRRTEI